MRTLWPGICAFSATIVSVYVTRLICIAWPYDSMNSIDQVGSFSLHDFACCCTQL